MSAMNRDNLDQAEGLRQLTRNKAIQVIAITAGKGGVGKSNVSVNLAVALAKSGKKVMILDADLGLANVDIMFGLHARYNLSHVIQGQCELSDIIIEGPVGIKVVPAASGIENMASLSTEQHAGIINAFNEITEDIDFLLIDTAAGISDTVLSFTRSSREIIVIVCDEPTSLTDAYALIKVMSKRYGWAKFHILANMVRNIREGRELYQKLYRVATQFLDVTLDYLGAIPFDEKIHDAVKKQMPILIAYPEAEASKKIQLLADNVLDWPCEQGVGGNTTFFLERSVTTG